MNRYCLANYKLTITSADSELSTFFGGAIEIGADNGNQMNNISISRSSSLYSTSGYATGGYVHNKNLSEVGSASVQLNQMSDNVIKLITLFNMFYQGDYEGLTLTVTTPNGKKVAECIDCYITNIPQHTFGNEATDQTWSFTCGRVQFTGMGK